MKSTIELAHNLGLKAIAEGVQDKYTLDRLTALGCDVAQGDYICAPLGGSALLDWLRHRAATVYEACFTIGASGFLRGQVSGFRGQHDSPDP